MRKGGDRHDYAYVLYGVCLGDPSFFSWLTITVEVVVFFCAYSPGEGENEK